MSFVKIIITRPDFLPDEAARIAAFLDMGKADLVHIRKPGAGAEQVERLLRQIPQQWHGRLVLHDAFCLAAEYGVHGVHLNSRNSEPPTGWRGSVSRSCHSPEEVERWAESMDYVSLSPIFDSVSKPGYTSRFTEAELRALLSGSPYAEKIYALGGITFSRLDEVRGMGFGGAMILGDAWRE